MHVIVDIRTTSPQEMMPVRAGIAWARLWKKHKPDDIITFLIYEHQEKIDGFDTIVVDKPFGPFGRKKLATASTNQIFRSVSFSEFGRYDPTIPMISHVCSNAVTLYGNPSESTLVKKYNDYKRKRIFSESHCLVVPDIQIGRELVEIYDVREENIEIIPHLPVSEFCASTPLQYIQTPLPFFIYDGGYGNESNILTLLSAWERYKNSGGTYELLLLGAAMDELSAITQIIRSLGISESVRYLGNVNDTTLDTLYKKAKGWIYTGPYYSAGLMIEYARVYRLPLLLSNIRVFDGYQGIKIHPNHLLDIVSALHQLEDCVPQNINIHPDNTYIQAYEKILAKKS